MTAIAALTVLSWICLTRMAGSMGAAGTDTAMSAAMGMPEMAAWGWAEFVMLFLMWALMMFAMMLPAMTPVLLVVVAIYQRRGVRATQLTTTFAVGYLLAWTLFSAFAAATQYGLHRALMKDMTINSALLSGIVLVIAGAYQSLPLKGACLTHCRSPLAFLAREWREGAAGALEMGSRHGLYCVGCCWALMLLLFAAGVMNLFWVAAIAVLVLIEKVAPRGAQVGEIVGVGLVLWGAWLVGYGLSA
jgi:predicted metal-binding membrane protein